jgi:hypothetical protein
MPTWPSPFDHRLGTPKIPAIRSTRASHFVASLVRFRYGLPGCSPPCTDQTGRPAFGDFYFQAFNGSVSLSVAGYNYNSGWISLCWRDLHPLEWQLASLHGQTEKNLVCADGFWVAAESGRRSMQDACLKRPGPDMYLVPIQWPLPESTGLKDHERTPSLDTLR